MVLKIKHLIARIELVDEQLSEIDKKSRRVLRKDQLSYPVHTRDFAFLWYVNYSRVRKYRQVFKAF